MHIASERGCVNMVKLLVDSGASLVIKTKVDYKGRGGRTAAQMAKFGAQVKCYNLLLEYEQSDPTENITNTLAEDLETGYRLSEPYAGSGVAVAKKSIK